WLLPPHVIGLELESNSLDDHDVAEFASCEGVGYLRGKREGLRWLNLNGNPLIGLRGLQSIATSPYLQQLEILFFEANAITSPSDQLIRDEFGMVVDSHETEVGKALQEESSVPLLWLRAPTLYGDDYPPLPEELP